MALPALAVDLFWFVLACMALVLSGSLVVRTLSRIARFLRLSEFVVAFLIMALATSIPELFVGITSALAKTSALSLGTVIGSNIIDLTFVIGIAILLGRGIAIKSAEIKRDTLFMVVIAILPLLMMVIGGSISRIEGAILLAIFLGYQYYLYTHRRMAARRMYDGVSRWEALAAPFLFLLGVALLFVSAQYVVTYGVAISTELGVPPILVGIILIAIGTSLPELAFESHAVLEGHSEMALGDAIGSVIANSTLVLGVTAVIYPITANLFLFFISAAFMVFIVLLFCAFAQTARRLSWHVGLVLILFYIFFLIIELYVRNLQGAPII